MTDVDDGIRHFNNSETDQLGVLIQKSLRINTDQFWSLLKLGAIYVNNERQTKNKIIQANSLLRVHTQPRRYPIDYAWNSLVVFENDFCLVLNKPSGLPSHAVVDNATENALAQMSLVRGYPLYVTHRLDTLTSGLIVYAKKQSFVKSFNQQLLVRSVRKKYVAQVEGSQVFSEKLVHYMCPVPGVPKKLSDQPQEGWWPCELEILEQKPISSDIQQIKINLLTGRTHQIRSQLSHMGAPLVGDSLYGAQLPYKPRAIALRSCEIEFDCGEERLKFKISEELN